LLALAVVRQQLFESSSKVLPLESSRKAFGEFATQFFVEVLENGRGLALPLELGGRSDSAFIDRMTVANMPLR
jgi:hypothetical protein